MGFELVGESWTAEEFAEYLSECAIDLDWAEGVCMHHTASPNLAQRPNGFTAQHIRNIADYYQNHLGWGAGPHLFVDDHCIWGMSSLQRPGVHARSYNAAHIGIEVLGNYDTESPFEGRGAQAWRNAALAVNALDARMNYQAEVVFHRDDPRTNKSCPGNNIPNVSWFVELCESLNDGQWSTAPAMRGPIHSEEGLLLPTPALNDLEDRFAAMEWQVKKLHGITGDRIQEIADSLDWQLEQVREMISL
jgi:hypothetical protein